MGLTHLSRRAYQRRSEPHFVYQLWNGPICLYVGMSYQLPSRLTAWSRQPWWPQVERIEAQRFSDKERARELERSLIAEHQPVYNFQGTQRASDWARAQHASR